MIGRGLLRHAVSSEDERKRSLSSRDAVRQRNPAIAERQRRQSGRFRDGDMLSPAKDVAPMRVSEAKLESNELHVARETR